jgi:hypothetical protein
MGPTALEGHSPRSRRLTTAAAGERRGKASSIAERCETSLAAERQDVRPIEDGVPRASRDHVTKKAPADAKPEPTHYVNVDFDVYARVPLDSLVQALGDEALVLYVGGGRRKYEAHLELASSHMAMSADDTIVGLTHLIRALPRVHREIWDSAQRREFNIGIEAGLEPHGFELRLQQQTLKAITDVRGVLVVTVYAPDLRAASLPAKRRPKKR